MEENIHVQIEDILPSIEQILRPISNTFWLLGGSIIYPPKSPKIIPIITCIIHTAIFFFMLISNLLHITSIYKENELIQYIYLLNELIRYVLICYNIYYGVRLYEKWPKLMDRLKELDQKLEKEIPLNNGFIQIIQLKNVIKIIPNFIAFIAHPLILIISIWFFHVSDDLYSIFYINLVLMFDLIMQSMINSFFFDIIVYVLYCRFQTINELIGQLDELSNVQWITFKIRRIRELHADICDLASMVNDIYSRYLFFCSASYFTMAVTTLFQVYMEIITEVYIIVLFEIVYAMQFFLVCWICTVACEESNKTGRIIHKIILNCKSVNLDKNEASNQSSLEMLSALDDLNSEHNSNSSSHNLNYIVLENLLHKHLNQDCVRNEINDFSAQLQQNRVAFTACNFFELNNVSLSCFVGMNLTYLITFVQLYQPTKY